MKEKQKSEVQRFKEERESLNEIVMDYGGLEMKRFFNLDTQVYEEGELSKKFKEMLGLVASTVLKCDDCIEYHIINCAEEGVTDDELQEVMSIAMVVGGSITIPHVRRAFKLWDEIKEGEDE